MEGVCECVRGSFAARHNGLTLVPTSPQSESHNWWDLIQVQNGSSFDTTNGVHVEVNWADHKAIHLYADPEFLQYYDQVIQHANGALSSTMTGTIDECGWPVRFVAGA